MDSAKDRFAVVDIGTNTLLLLIVERAADGTLEPIVDLCRFGRLGKGLDDSGNLAQVSIDRSLEIVAEYAAVLKEHGVSTVRAVGTQALREAGNAALFVEPATRMFGAPIEVIGGDREAELVATAVIRTFPQLGAETFVIADVGGGSTEVIVVQDGAPTFLRSVPIGSVRMAERHLRNDPPTAGQVAAMVADIDAHFANLPLPTGASLVGTAGTATTLAAVDLGLASYDPDRVNGHRLSPAKIDDQLTAYLKVATAERQRMAGLEPQRADVIPAGCAIFARLVHRLASPHMIVSDRGIRWGLAHLLADEQATARS